MANQTLGFGDKHTADVRLHLIDSTGLKYPGNPLLLHSQVLKKAELFETKLSQLLSSDKQPFEIKVTCCNYHPENYMKCILLMYSYETDERFNFSNVDEALVILPVSSEVMYLDCMESCMRYLCAVRWSPGQEAQLRVLLSSLQINVLPDLAARLGLSQSKSEMVKEPLTSKLRVMLSSLKINILPDLAAIFGMSNSNCGNSNCGPIEMVKESLQELLSLTSNGKEYRGTVEKHMTDYFESKTSPAVKDACRSAILKEFNANVEKIKSKSDDKAIALACSTLSWLVGVIQSCDAKLLETVVKVFCEDAGLRIVIARRVKQHKASRDLLTILIYRVLTARASGEIITAVSFRVDFLANWAETIAKLMENLGHNIVYGAIEQFQSALEKGIIGVGETLPLVEQKRIYNIWKDNFTINRTTTGGVFDWWAQKLHDAVIVQKII